jgi:hypothetical protein
MKNLVFFIYFLLSIGLLAQNKSEIQGAYILQEGEIQKLWLFVDGYSAMSEFKEKEYINSQGGPFQFSDNTLTISFEFNDKNPTKVGTKETNAIKLEGENFIDFQGNKWVKQHANVQDLDGAWKITERMVEGEMREIHQSGERKTIKLLVGGHFQWFAIDPSQKSFSGTGGGYYIFKNGIYTEKILFFSRDNSRVGANLEFEGEIQNGKWHHSGLSSKGEPIHEIWSKIN